jgi:periplasmic glucans biosynthesis protein
MLAAGAPAVLGGCAALAQQPSPPVVVIPKGVAFDPEGVRAHAALISKTPYQPPSPQTGAAMAVTYDGWRDLSRPAPGRARWTDNGSLVHLEYFPTGYIFKAPVDLYEVEGGYAQTIHYDPADFMASQALADAVRSIIGISGFRLQSPINKPDVFDEIAVFQGASYFRSLGRDQLYGLSARGISLGTGDAGEEFPEFRAFWIERPAPGAAQVVIHALLDGPSLAGAYRFTITPGPSTVFDVEASLFPRHAIANGGLAPQSSMFLFGAQDRRGVDDFRNEVHDSDGLEIRTQEGGRLWRPLTNPAKAQMSVFESRRLIGFGLCQRARRLDDYNDLEARYERRPSLWVEPVGDWGAGAVHLLEMPAQVETDDNIAAFWRPAEPWSPGQEVKFAYRLSWGPGPAGDGLASVIATRAGKAFNSTDRQYVVDFGDLPTSTAGLHGVVTASAGVVGPVSLVNFPDRAEVRTGFRFTPPASGSADIDLRLVGDNGDLSEAWRFRWT